MSSKTGTLFHCPKSDLLGDSGRVEWEVYEKVDLIELEYKGIRQGSYFSSSMLSYNRFTQRSREFHYFQKGTVLNLFLSTLHEVVIANFYLGRFEECLYLHFHGQWQHERMASNIGTLVPYWNCMDNKCPTPCRIPWNLVILPSSE